jgi:hypothetical protein
MNHKSNFEELFKPVISLAVNSPIREYFGVDSWTLGLAVIKLNGVINYWHSGKQDTYTFHSYSLLLYLPVTLPLYDILENNSIFKKKSISLSHPIISIADSINARNTPGKTSKVLSLILNSDHIETDQKTITGSMPVNFRYNPLRPNKR